MMAPDIRTFSFWALVAIVIGAQFGMMALHVFVFEPWLRDTPKSVDACRSEVARIEADLASVRTQCFQGKP